LPHCLRFNEVLYQVPRVYKFGSEQIMRIVQRLAGFSPEPSNNFRKAVGEKIKKKMPTTPYHFYGMSAKRQA
jgi:DNA polymerase III alpha subunit